MLVNGRWQKFTRYNIGIFDLPSEPSPPIIIKYWEKTRNHWRKNRKIFNLIFSYITVPLRILRLLEKKRKIDSNLIFVWKNLKYINLCSTLVLQKNKIVRSKRFLCQTTLFSRTSNTIFFIEKASGCVCCTNENGKQGPIWWDEWDIILKIFDRNSNKFLTSSFYNFSVLKQNDFSSKKKIVFLNKLPKIFNTFFVHISVLPFLKLLLLEFIKLKFIKRWVCIF